MGGHANAVYLKGIPLASADIQSEWTGHWTGQLIQDKKSETKKIQFVWGEAKKKKNLVEGNSLRINRKKGKNAVQLEGIPSASAAIQSEWTPFRSENCFQRRLCILLAGLLAEYQVLYIPDFLFHVMLFDDRNVYLYGLL